MKKVALIILMAGAGIIMIGLGIQSWIVRSEDNDKMAKVREAKAAKAAERKAAKDTELNETEDHGEEKDVHSEGN